MIETILGRVSGGENLTADEMAEAIGAIMDGEWSDEQIGMLLTALHAKGESVDEVVGATLALRNHMTRIDSKIPGILDTCGTGGDHSQTFNISTAVAFVVAAAGVPVAKHGNRGVTSKSGSANVLTDLGVNIDAPLDVVESCLDEIGLCFCFAPLWHPSMKRVGAVRQKLGIRTIFNLLGPLCNPASAPFQLIGVGDPNFRPLIANALSKLETSQAFVVHGQDRLDEITLNGPTSVSIVTPSGVTETEWRPEDFGVEQSSLESLVVDGPTASAKMIQEVFSGTPGPARDIILCNTSAALMVTGKVATPQEGASLAAEAIDSGAAKDILAKLCERTA